MAKSELYRAKNIEDLFHASVNRYQSAILDFGSLSQKTIELIDNQFNINVEGFNLVLDSDSLRHIYDRHFKDSKRFLISYLDNLLDFVNNAHLVECKLINENNHIIFHTKKPEGVFQFVCVIQTGRKRLSGKTLYVTRVKLHDNLTPRLTSLTGFNVGKSKLNSFTNQVLV